MGSADILARFVRPALVAATLAATGALLTGCGDHSGSSRALRPISSETIALFQNKGVDAKSPVLLRAFKKEAELEVWKMKADGKYVHVKTYPMCRWSGQLGPKRREGDRQVPEGFYAITPGAMNPNSNYYLSFNIGYPNAYDRAHGRTGGLIMVHGACSSAGCFSMTDEQIAEIYAIAREAFNGGQREIQMQSMPFRMNAENLAKFRFDPHMPFWRELKKGVDAFEVTKSEPQVAFCGRRYVFNATSAGGRLDANAACPPLQQDETIATAVAAKERQDEQQVAELVAKGVKPVRMVYADGGQHPDFKHIDMVSRPDALAQGPTEIELDHKGKPAPKPALVQVAAAKADAAAPAVAATPAAAPRGPAATLAKAEARDGATTIARAPATTGSVPAAPPAQPVAPAQSEAFYKKWLSFGFGSSNAKPAAEAVEPAPAPAVAPPRRASAPSKPQASAPKAEAPKPQASLGAPSPAAMTGLRAAARERLPAAILAGAAEPLPDGVRAYAPR
ncbi:MAG: murein L,D-transpeptidase [Methylobacteriaceae bacterium]|nr:murein L,D-transpeptidase [Methylobacteriaceae bacterium]